VGLTVTQAELVHDYVQIAFGELAALSVYNSFSLTPEEMYFDDLLGASTTSIIETESSITLSFSNHQRLVVDLSPQAYYGPESMLLNYKGFPTIIWN